MFRRLFIPLIALVLMLATIYPAFAQERGDNIITSIVNAPIVADGTTAGALPDFVINLDSDMNPDVAGRTLLAGNKITITIPAEFVNDESVPPADAFGCTIGDCNTAILLQGWPQHPIFSSFPPGDTSDQRYAISMPSTHELVITALVDLDGSLPLPGPGIKNIHVILGSFTNPAAGSYEIQVSAETGANGALEIGSGTIEISATAPPAISFTSVFNGEGNPNAIYQKVNVGDFLGIPYHLLAWNADGEPLSGAYYEYTSATTADILIDVPDEPRAPLKVGSITMTFPVGSIGGGIIDAATPEDIPAPNSGVTTTHLTIDYVAGSEPGMTTVEFALDGGNSITAFIEVSPRPLDSPGTRTWHGLSYDPLNDVVYLAGGRNQGCRCVRYKDVWAYDVAQTSWERKGDFADQLPPFAELDMSAYDTESEQLVIMAQGLHTDVVPLIYTPATNTLVEGSKDNLPPFRFEPGMAYDPDTDRVVIFGGTNVGDSLDDTWLYDTNSDSWTELATTGTPPSRDRFAMDYDSDADRIIIYGGGHGFLFSGDFRSDTWELDVATGTWSEIVTPIKPEMQEQVGGAYDSQSKKFIVYGLSVTGAYETWALDYDAKTWTLMNTIVDEERASGPRAHHADSLIYSPSMDRVLLYGGNINWNDSSRASAEFWAYDYDNNRWEQIEQPPTAIGLGTLGSAVPVMSGVEGLLSLLLLGASVGAIRKRRSGM